MKLNDFLAFDVETATRKKGSICQIGYVIVRDLKIVKEFFRKVRPPDNDYEPAQTGIHHMNSNDTKHEPEFPEIWKLIREDFESNLLVAHNVKSTERPALIQTLENYGLEVPDLKWFCTYELTDLALVDACESLCVELTKHHDALADAKACANILIKMTLGEKLDESLITPKEKKSPFDGYEHLHGAVLKKNLDVDDKDNPFYDKRVVITGKLSSMEKNEAAEILQGKGANVNTSISKLTDFVITGSGAGPVKLEKVAALNSKGAGIELLKEDQFLKMINQ